MAKVASKVLNPRKAAGSDNIRPSILKQVFPFIIKPLTHIFNNSLRSGIPDQLKIAKVIPIHKKGDKDVISHYRPISILPCLAKLLERLIINRLNSFLDSHNILSKCQYGFRPGHSTELALADVTDQLYSAIEKECHSIGVFFDLSKAFDTIDHKILLSKLSNYGIRGGALSCSVVIYQIESNTPVLMV